MTRRAPAARAMTRRALTAGALLLAAAGCDAWVTKPVRFNRLPVQVLSRTGYAVPGAKLVLYTGPFGSRPMGYGTTDAFGAHTFTLVPDGIYGVYVTPPEGFDLIENLIVAGPSNVVDNVTLARGVDTTIVIRVLKKGPGRIDAYALEPGGVPVPGLVVTRYRSSGTLDSAVTNASGVASFAPAAFGLYGVSFRRAPRYRDIGEPELAFVDGLIVDEGTTAVAQLSLVPCGGTVTGSVLTTGGVPIAGTRVSLNTAAGLVRDTIAGANGAFAFPGLLCDNYGVRIAPRPGWTLVEGKGSSYDDGLFVRRSGSPPATTIRVAPPPCVAAIRATVTGPTGTPVGGATVSLYTGTTVLESGASGADGTVLFPSLSCALPFGIVVVAPAGYSVTPGAGGAFFDNIALTNGATAAFTFRLNQP